jgi:hypothetical protein
MATVQDREAKLEEASVLTPDELTSQSSVCGFGLCRHHANPDTILSDKCQTIVICVDLLVQA